MIKWREYLGMWKEMLERSGPEAGQNLLRAWGVLGITLVACLLVSLGP